MSSPTDISDMKKKHELSPNKQTRLAFQLSAVDIQGRNLFLNTLNLRLLFQEKVSRILGNSGSALHSSKDKRNCS